MLDVGESDAQLGQTLLEAAERRGGARVYDRRLRPVDPIGRDHPTMTEVEDVDRRDGHRCSVDYRSATGTKSRVSLPTKICLGRAMLCSLSLRSSSHCANHPTVLGIAKSTGNISTGNRSAS